MQCYNAPSSNTPPVSPLGGTQMSSPSSNARSVMERLRNANAVQETFNRKSREQASITQSPVTYAASAARDTYNVSKKQEQ